MPNEVFTLNLALKYVSLY